MSARRLVLRLLALLRQRHYDRDLDDEIAAHLELAERDGIARGLTPEAARREARRAFGSVARARELHRDSRSVRWLEHLVRDVRYGAASLARDPLFTIVAVGVLALGIGANTAMFSLVDGVLFKPLPFADPDRLVRVWEAPSATSNNPTTTRLFLDLQRQNRSFEALSAESASTATIDVGGEPVRWTGRYVSADHFRVFGVRPLLGRDFSPEEDRPGAEPVVILSHAAWQTYSGGDRGILGRELRLDNVPHRVIGVLPPGVLDRQRERPLEAPASFWRLNAFTQTEIESGAHWLNPVGRLKPGVSLAQARDDLLSIRARIASELPAWKQEWGLRVEPYETALLGDQLRRSLYVALGAVVFVLLIACANLTNLLLTRATARRKEIALRALLGASRGRLVMQLLTECVLIAGLGGVAGLGVATLMVHGVVPLLPPMPYTAQIGVDARVLAFATAATLLVCVLVGVWPALRGAGAPAGEALASASRGSTGTSARMRRAIVTAEVAVSVVLLCGAFLLLRSLLELQRVDVGVRMDDVVTMSLDFPRDRYPSGAALAGFYPTLVERVAAVPGVVSTSISGDVPLEGTGGDHLILVGDDERLAVRFKRIDPGYLATLGIPLLAGRGFSADDRVGAPNVAIVNQALERLLAERVASQLGSAGVVGQSVNLPLLGFGPNRRTVMTVVGVIGNERVRSDLRTPIEPVAYVPIAQAPRLQVKLSVLGGRDAAALVPAIRDAIRQVEPRLALADVRTMRQIWQGSLSGLLQPVWLVGAFALVSAALAAFGLYGVLAHTVVQRRREIGIRLALGADAGRVAGTIVRETLVTVVAGLGLGVAGVAVLSRAMEGLLFEVSPLDPSALVLGSLVMGAVAATAALVPTRRAARVNPVEVLQGEG